MDVANETIDDLQKMIDEKSSQKFGYNEDLFRISTELVQCFTPELDNAIDTLDALNNGYDVSDDEVKEAIATIKKFTDDTSDISCDLENKITAES